MNNYQKLLNRIKEHKRLSKWQKLFGLVACLVVFVTTYMLILPAITEDSTLICGMEEHTHTSECYTVEKTLICDKEEQEAHHHSDECYKLVKELVCTNTDPDHEHSDECYEMKKELVCGKEETDGHTHTSDCYKEEKTLTCKKTEHEHTTACYAKAEDVIEGDSTADLETKADWEKTIKDVKLTGKWDKDVVAIAKSQLGYHESTKNYIKQDNEKKGYTRYGAWYGDKYGDWCAMYASFCIHYAGVDDDAFPLEASCENWIEELSKDDYNLYHKANSKYEVKAGDLVFFNLDKENDADHVGIVVKVYKNKNDEITSIKTIEGNSSDKVKYCTYKISNSKILGYGELPEASDASKETKDTDKTFKLSAVAKDGMKVTVSGDTSALPENQDKLSVSIIKLSDKETKQLAKETGVDSKDYRNYGYDVSLWSGDTEIEPVDRVSVTFEFDGIGSYNETDIYHFEDGAAKGKKMKLEKDEVGLVKFNTESFSKYLVTTEGVTYDSDLEDFLKSATLTDYNGNTISNGDTVYIGQNYTITLSFAESNVSGSEQQFHYDEEGYLTYQVDTTNLILKEVSNASITQADGTVVGHYWLSTDGTLKVKFDNVDNSGTETRNTYFDNYRNTVFNLSFDATVSATEAGKTISIPFSDDIEITGKVDAGGDLDVTKTAGTANNDTHSMTFTVQVKCTEGVVSQITLDDVPNVKLGSTAYGASIDVSSITFTDLDGNALDEQPTVTQNTDGSISVAYPTALQAGEGFLVNYTVIADDEVYAELFENGTGDDYRIAKNIYFTNSVEVKGNNGTDTPVDKTVTAEKSTWVSLLQKSHTDMTITDKDKNTIDVVRWNLSIGDKCIDIGGSTVTDTIGEGLSFLTNSGNVDYIRVNIKKTDGSSQSINYYYDQDQENHVTLSSDGKTATLVLPDDCTYAELTYYTTYTTGNTNDGAYTNTASVSVDGFATGTVSNTSTAGTGVPTIDKTVTGSDENYIYYQIVYDIPADMDGQTIYFQENPLSVNVGGRSYAMDMSILHDFKVTVQKASDSEPVEYVYGTSGADGTYNYKSVNGTSYWRLAIDSTDADKDRTWKISEHSVVTITFGYPRSSVSEDLTLDQCLFAGAYVRNTAYVYYGNSSLSDTVTYYSEPELVKTGSKDTYGYIDYTVQYATYTTDNTTNLRTAAISKPFENAYFYDDYDSKLDLSSSIRCRAYNVSTGKQAYFVIDGDDVEINTTNSTLKAYWKDFIVNTSWSTITVDEGTDLETFLNNEDLSNYRLYFYYSMSPTSDAIDSSTTSIEVNNKAQIGYTGTDTDGNPFNYVTPETSFDYSYTPDYIDKTGTQSVDGGNEINYTIDVNNDYLNLSDGMTYQVVDQMSDNMTVYLDSIEFKFNAYTFDLTNKTTEEEFIAEMKKIDSSYTDDELKEWWSSIKEMLDMCKVTYDETNHKLTFTVPDEAAITISYTTKINDTGTSVKVSNTASINGLTSATSGGSATYEVNNTSGSAGGSSKYLYVLKQDSTNLEPVYGAKIALYGETNKGITAPDGVDQTITVEGKTLYYYATYESDENSDSTLDGTFKITDDYLADGGFYALKEIAAPDCYILSEDPIPFYWDSKPDSGIDGVEVKQSRDTLIFQNTPESYSLPKTGGIGTKIFTMSGTALIVIALVYGYVLKRRRERAVNQ